METRIYVIMTGVVLLAVCSTVQAVNKDFYSSGQILPGESWDIVNIYNDDTVVDMLGGSADYISTFDASSLNVVDGYAQVGAFDYSSINISGGILSGAEASNYATVDFNGDATSAFLGASQFGVANMTGGTLDRISAVDSGIVNLFAGNVLERLWASDSSVINIYGYDLMKSDSGGTYGYGVVTGFLTDDTYISVDLSNPEAYEHINLIPEPCTLALVAMGLLLLRRKR